MPVTVRREAGGITVPARGLEARRVVKLLGVRRVLDDVSLGVEAGEVVALFGPNGAGKTTLLRCLCGIEGTTLGGVYLGGVALDRRNPDQRRAIGLMGHDSFLYAQLSAQENLLLFARLYRVKAARDRVQEALDAVGLLRFRAETVGHFSAGMKQRLSLARAQVHDPEVLLLDEPYSGLDDEATLRLEAVLTDRRRRLRCTLLVTHDLERGRKVADRIGVLRGGRLCLWQPASAVARDDWVQVYRRALRPEA